MKRPERLNDMMIYLNDKKIFSLKSMMDRYSISKSTALRDVRSLEELGMPIYSKAGRSGHYGILPNRLLSPILFTMDEVYALYFSMQTLSAYQSTPFHLSLHKLKQKFEGCLSQERIDKLRKMEAVFRLGSYQNERECRCLEEIVHMAVDESVCEVYYAKGEAEKRYDVQFFDITSAYGQWYATAYNFQAKRPQVLRCDKIRSVRPCARHTAKPLSEFLASPKELFRDEGAVDFEVGITVQGTDLFYKEHYPSMELCRENGNTCIRGFYNEGEEKFIAGYFAAYGEAVLSVRPDGLKARILERLDAIRNHFASI